MNPLKYLARQRKRAEACPVKPDGVLAYTASIEISASYAALAPNNCAVRERTADGTSVGVCTHYLTNGTTCPRHGVVKISTINDNR